MSMVSKVMKRIDQTVLCLLLGGSLALAVPVSAKEKPSAALEMARQLNQAFIEVADDVSPAVVVISVTQKPTAREMGSGGDDSLWGKIPQELRKHLEGWGGSNRPPRAIAHGSGIVISEDGYILTNNHVVENADKIKVRFKDGKQWDAEVKGTDPESDIAVIKINAKGLEPAKLGDSDKTRVGEFAIAIGAPFDLSYSVTVGHVSGKGRSFEGYSDTYMDQDFLQTDASINPGNSGGPLVNLYGEVIGINAMIRGMNTGIGFAIPINLAKRVKDHLISEGKFTRSWIGVRISDLKENPTYKGLDPSVAPSVEEGVMINEIESGGPAAKSSLKPFDVVVAVDGVAIKTPRDLKNEISTKKVGDSVTLDVVRGAKRVAVKVKTDALPGEGPLVNVEHKTADVESSPFGLSVQPLTKELADQYNVEITTGVIVTSVEPNTPASDQGIKAGDIVTEINRKPISNTREFREALKGSQSKSGTIVNLISNGSSKFVVLKEGEADN